MQERALGENFYKLPARIILMQTSNLLQEHNWLALHPKEIEKFRGKWVAVLGEKIIDTGGSYGEVFGRVKKFIPQKYPLITYILKKEEENFVA